MSSSRIKVMLVIRQLIIGGAESQTFELARGLDRRRFDVTVVTLQPGGYFRDRLEAEGVRVIEIHKRHRYDLFLLPRLIALLLRERPQIVHCVMWTANTWAGLAALLTAQSGLILSVRSTGIWKSWLHRMTGPLIFNRARTVLANSNEVARYLIDREGINAGLVKVVWNGIDLSRYQDVDYCADRSDVRAELGIPEEAFVAGIVANLSRQKDYPTFVKAAGLIAASVEKSYFLVVGEGPERPSIEQQREKLGLKSRLLLVGQQTDVARYLRAMDCFVLTSLREGFSNALLEAMATGLPVLVSRTGGNIGAVREGENGYLFEVGDADVLARRLVQLSSDPALCERLGSRGREFVSQSYAMAVHIEKMTEIYLNILGQRL